MVRSVRIDDVPPAPNPGEPAVWRPVRHHLGIHAFGINAWTGVEAGDAVIEEHDETDDHHEELYLVVSGRATFVVDGEEADAPERTLVFVPDPASSRRAVAVEAGTTILSIGAAPGETYTVSDWEHRHFPAR